MNHNDPKSPGYVETEVEAAKRERERMTAQQEAYKTHEWRLKKGWKAFYKCRACGIDDIDPKSWVICAARLPNPHPPVIDTTEAVVIRPELQRVTCDHCRGLGGRHEIWCKVYLEYLRQQQLCACGHSRSVHSDSHRYPCATCYCSGFEPIEAARLSHPARKETKMETMLPNDCPKCGSSDTALSGRDDDRWIECRRCDHGGPSAKTKEDAIVAWNGLSHPGGELGERQEQETMRKDEEWMLMKSAERSKAKPEAAPALEGQHVHISHGQISCNKCRCSNPVQFGVRHYTDCPLYVAPVEAAPAEAIQELKFIEGKDLFGKDGSSDFDFSYTCAKPEFPQAEGAKRYRPDLEPDGDGYIAIMREDRNGQYIRYESQPSSLAGTPSEGELTYDGMHYIFLQTASGPRIFAEIRGYGSGLPMDANAQRICDLWNDANKKEIE